MVFAFDAHLLLHSLVTDEVCAKPLGHGAQTMRKPLNRELTAISVAP